MSLVLFKHWYTTHTRNFVLRQHRFPILMQKLLYIICCLKEFKKIHTSYNAASNRKFVVCFLLGNSPASEFYMPKFRNTQSVPSS